MSGCAGGRLICGSREGSDPGISGEQQSEASEAERRNCLRKLAVSMKFL